MPSVNAEDAFIPPQPASATEDKIGDGGEATAGEAPETDSEAEESGEEESEQAPAPSRVSLFERVTGSSRKVFGKKSPEPVETSEAPEVSENKEISATEEAPEQDPDPNGAGIEEASETGGNELGGLDPEDRLPASETDDDLLDIPAFLRRQAN